VPATLALDIVAPAAPAPDATRRDRGFSKTETPNWRVGFFAASGLVERLHDQGWLLAPGEPREAMRNPMK
jgi:DNA-binding transcriptional MocR family regulator